MDYKVTFTDGSKALAHHGVKGMKWGVWNAETRARYYGGKVKEYGQKYVKSGMPADRARLQSASESLSRQYGSGKQVTRRMVKAYGLGFPVGALGGASIGAALGGPAGGVLGAVSSALIGGNFTGIGNAARVGFKKDTQRLYDQHTREVDRIMTSAVKDTENGKSYVDQVVSSASNSRQGDKPKH